MPLLDLLLELDALDLLLELTTDPVAGHVKSRRRGGHDGTAHRRTRGRRAGNWRGDVGDDRGGHRRRGLDLRERVAWPDEDRRDGRARRL
jgi:hypothetical protein